MVLTVRSIWHVSAPAPSAEVCASLPNDGFPPLSSISLLPHGSLCPARAGQQNIIAQNTERTSSALKAWVRLQVPTSFFHEPRFTALEVFHLSGAHIHTQEQKGEIRSARSASSLLRTTSSGIHPDATPTEVHGHRRDMT